MEEALKDERFSHILTDPRFRRIPKNVRKIKVDNRFKNLFKSKKFTEKCRVDERGRSLNLEPSENLQKLYNLDEDSSESDEEDDVNVHSQKAKKTKKLKNANTKKSSKNLTENKNSKDKEQSLHSESSDSNEEISEQDILNGTVNCSKILNNKKSKKKDSKKSLRTEKISQNYEPFEVEEVEVAKNIASNKNKKSVQKKTSLNAESFEFSKSDKMSKKNKNVKKSLFRIDTLPDPRFVQKNESEHGISSESSEEEDTSIKSDKSFGIKTHEEVDESEESEEEKSEVDSSSDSEEESENSDSEDSTSNKSDSFDHQWEEQHERAPDTDEITRRLAVCNMDWDRIRAVDLYAVFNSFKPPDTSISSVKIYPSEYGLKRMEEEKLNGPTELVEKTLAPNEEEVEDKKGGKYHREKLRQYQMNRLKYYYAIVECDSAETANSLYEQLNGMEYESSSVRFDLRFVPDGMTFDQEPSSVADNIPDLTEYKPRLFVTTALQQVKVGLTWDETDPHRRETLQKAFTEPDSIEKDIKDYLASSSGESDDEIADEEEGGLKLSTKERIQKYKALLESLNEQEKEKSEEKYEMEITWEPGAKEKTENLIKEKLEEKTFTPFEELQKKKKEKQKLKKKEKKSATQEEKESENSVADYSDSDESVALKAKNKAEKESKTTDELYLISDSRKLDDDKQTSKKKKKKKAKEENTDDFKVDVNDPRFSAIYTSPLFNIDPSDPHFKSTPGNLAIIAEKQRRLKNKAFSQEEASNKKFKYK